MRMLCGAGGEVTNVWRLVAYSVLLGVCIGLLALVTSLRRFVGPKPDKGEKGA